MSTYFDLRGFSYPLSALLEKRCWELERCQEELAKADERVGQTSAALSELHDRMRLHHEQLLSGLRQPLLPERRQQWLLYLATQQEEAAALISEMEKRQRHAQQLRRQCMTMHAGVKTLEEHRHALLSEHIMEQRRHMAAEMDKAWITRSAWLSGLEKSGTRRVE